MTTAETNTKIERVVEGVESLTNAVFAHQLAERGKRGKSFNAVILARKELRDGLVNFLKPTLRVVTHKYEDVT